MTLTRRIHETWRRRSRECSVLGSPGTKIRPALIVQADSLNGMLRETTIAAITSNLVNVHQAHQLVIEIAKPECAGSGLLTDSAVRCERLQSVPQTDVKRVIGHLSPVLMARIDDCLKAALSLS